MSCTMRETNIVRLRPAWIQMFCGHCGEKMETNWQFCVFCGKTLKKEGNTESPSEGKTEVPETGVVRKQPPSGELENVYKSLTPDGKSSLTALRKKYNKAGSESSDFVLNVQLLGIDRKGIRNIGGNPGKFSITVIKTSNSEDWKKSLKSCFKRQNFSIDDVFFVINKGDEKSEITLEMLLERKKRLHKKDLMVYAVLPRKRNNLTINYDRKELKKPVTAKVPATATVTSATVTLSSEEDTKEKHVIAKVPASATVTSAIVTSSSEEDTKEKPVTAKVPATATVTSATVTLSSEEDTKEKSVGDEKKVKKCCVKRLRITKTSSDTTSTEQDSADDFIETEGTFGKELSDEPAFKMKKLEPSESFLEEWLRHSLEEIKAASTQEDAVASTSSSCASTAKVCDAVVSTDASTSTMCDASHDVDAFKCDAVVSIDCAEQEEAERDMERYFELQTRKENRQKICSERVIGQGRGKKNISVIYTAHGGIGMSLSVPPEVPLQFVFDFICAYTDPEVLPPKFSLQDADNVYTTYDKHTCGEVGDMLFIKEELYELNDTITNFDEVFF